MGQNLNHVNFEIEGTFYFGASGNNIFYTRNFNHNNVGGYMKGRSVIAGEKSRTKYPTLTPPKW